jgi:hypothetical protein
MKKNTMIWFGIGAAVATLATLFLIRKKGNAQSEKPPKKAPQLDIENPGDQSEFTSMASESELG